MSFIKEDCIIKFLDFINVRITHFCQFEVLHSVQQNACFSNVFTGE